jgi:gamma-glutamyl phosphate reductase
MSEMRELARRAREAQRRLAAAPDADRTAALVRLAAILDGRREAILAANQRDLARADTLAPSLRSRLKLSPEKLATLRAGLQDLAEEEDPVGRVLRRTELDDGLTLSQVMSPLGVLLIIFESRPDAVIQIGGLALRSGNAVILKGGSEARESNAALVAALRDSLRLSGLPEDAVQGVEGREAVAALLEQDAFIDLVIPRGSGELVRHIQASTRIPVLGHAEGVCCLYLHEDADPEMSARIAVDGKTDYPAACNATESLVVHRGFLPHLPAVAAALVAAGVTLRADPEARAALPDAEPVTDADAATEYGAPILSVHVVGGLDEAVDFIHANGSGHTDAIVTSDAVAAEAFLRRVDSASVFHNASTRFADGYRYGLGAEVGISTGRIHARGPVGIEGLMTTRWLLRGAGQGAGDYRPGGRSFTHRRLPIEG